MALDFAAVAPRPPFRLFYAEHWGRMRSVDHVTYNLLTAAKDAARAAYRRLSIPVPIAIWDNVHTCVLVYDGVWFLNCNRWRAAQRGQDIRGIDGLGAFQPERRRDSWWQPPARPGEWTLFVDMPHPALLSRDYQLRLFGPPDGYIGTWSYASTDADEAARYFFPYHSHKVRDAQRIRVVIRRWMGERVGYRPVREWTWTRPVVAVDGLDGDLGGLWPFPLFSHPGTGVIRQYRVDYIGHDGARHSAFPHAVSAHAARAFVAGTYPARRIVAVNPSV